MKNNPSRHSRFQRCLAIIVCLALLQNFLPWTLLADNMRELLAPGYLLQVSSAQDRKLNGTFRIEQDGNLELPYQITIQTHGLGVQEFQEKLQQAYAPYFKSTPDVRVTVKQRRYWIELRGLVQKPGTFLVKKEAPLDEILSLAGGISSDPSPSYARVEQSGHTVWIDLDEYFKLGHVDSTPQWEGGEKIFFQKERGTSLNSQMLHSAASHTPGRIQVLGEVKNPGEQSYRPEADGYHYLTRSGGPITSANLDKVEIVRLDPTTGKRRPISLGPIAEVPPIQDGDIMIVHPERPSSWEKALVSTSIVVSIVTASLLAVIAVKGTK